MLREVFKGPNICRPISLDIHACAEIFTEALKLRDRYGTCPLVKRMLWASFAWKHTYNKPGWLTVLGWQASIASGAFACAGIIQTFIQIVNPAYVPQLWHATLLYYAILAIAVFVTVLLGSALSKIEGFFLVVYIVGFFALLVPLVWLSHHRDAHDVFGTFLNEGEWNTQGLSFMVGLSGVAFDFLGNLRTFMTYVCGTLTNAHSRS